MYPRRQLAALAGRKAALRVRIAGRRSECAAAGAELAHAVEWVDRGLALWRRVAPLVKTLAVPAGALLARVFKGSRHDEAPAPKRGKIARLLRALPMILQGVKFALGLRGARG